MKSPDIKLQPFSQVSVSSCLHISLYCYCLEIMAVIFYCCCSYPLGISSAFNNSFPLTVSSWFSPSSSYILSLFTHMVQGEKASCEFQEIVLSKQEKEKPILLSFNISLLWKCFCWKLPRHKNGWGRVGRWAGARNLQTRLEKSPATG